MVKNFTTGYITEREKLVIGRLSYEKIDIISRKKFDEYFNNFSPAVRSKIIYRLGKKRILKKIKKGLYIFSPLEAGPDGRNINEYLIPGLFFPDGDYYIGYSTMYNYYGFTEQIFQVIYVLNIKIQKIKTINGMKFKFVKISKNRLYGIIEKEIMGQKVNISDRERTLVDLLYYPEPIGGIKRAYEVMVEQIKTGKINLKRFLEYLIKFPSVITRKRAGYILEKNGFKTGNLIKTINSKSLLNLYDNKTRSGKINKKWGIIINDTQ